MRTNTLEAVVDHEVTDALFGFVASLQSQSTQHVAAALVGAGIVPIMVDLVARAPLDGLELAARGVVILEPSFYATPNASVAFFAADGLATYLIRAKVGVA
jgi:hypothetical protein